MQVKVVGSCFFVGSMCEKMTLGWGRERERERESFFLFPLVLFTGEKGIFNVGL